MAAQSFSSSSTDSGNRNVSVCFCHHPAKIVKSWTVENPGRRFLRCRGGQGLDCKYFAWFDVEKPHGWQHVALLEARKAMIEQKEEIERLKMLLLSKTTEEIPIEVSNDAHVFENLKGDLTVMKSEITMMRNMLTFTCVGMAVVIGFTVAWLK